MRTRRRAATVKSEFAAGFGRKKKSVNFRRVQSREDASRYSEKATPAKKLPHREGRIVFRASRECRFHCPFRTCPRCHKPRRRFQATICKAALVRRRQLSKATQLRRASFSRRVFSCAAWRGLYSTPRKNDSIRARRAGNRFPERLEKAGIGRISRD